VASFFPDTVYIKYFDDDVYKHDPVSGAAGDDVAGTFVETLEEHIKQIYRQFKFPISMTFTKVDEEQYMRTTKCHICDGELATLLEDLEEQHTMVAT